MEALNLPVEEKLERYRQIIQQIIHRYAQFKPSVGEVEVEVVFDRSNDHYELLFNGWHRTYRIQGPVLHVDIRNQKIYIQHDGTEEGIADELVEAGVPREDIVLAFRAPEVRPFTGFAIS